jgi:DNA invertase Pin-like site-specific DNA recombinase
VAQTTVTPSSVPPQLRVALYARVSTSNGQQDPEMQLRELREYAERRGWRIAGEYVDHLTGSKDSRPSLNRLVTEAHQRHFDVLLVWRFDRFARSVSHLLRALETFQSLRIDFVSLSENVDTSTPTGKMVFTVLGAVAELERSLIVERVKAGIRNARAKGKRIGRPGNKVNPAAVLLLRSSGDSIRAIATQLDSSVGTVARVLAENARSTRENRQEVLHA